MPRRPVMPARPRRAAIAATAIPLAALLALGALKMAAPAEGQAGPSATAAAATPNARVLGHPAKDKLPPEKREGADAEERRWQEIVKQPAVPKGKAAPPPAAPAARLRTGDETRAGAGNILPGSAYPFRTSNRFENHWVEETANGTITVWAGADGANKDQGLVVVFMMGPARGDLKEYRTPTKAGSLRITGASGERMDLVSATGARFTFDLASRTFSTR